LGCKQKEGTVSNSDSPRVKRGLVKRFADEVRLVSNQRTGGFPKTIRPPKYLFVEVTNNCNLRCVHCIRPLMTRPVGYMDLGLYKRLIDQTGPDLKILDYSGWGEPLFHPDIAEMIDYAKDAGVAEVISNTNVTTLTPELTDKVLSSRLDSLVFSLDAVSPGAYKKIRIGSDYDLVHRNIDHYFETRARTGRKGPTTVAQLILMKNNQDEVEEFRRRWSDVFDVVTIRPLASLGQQSKAFKKIHVHYYDQPRTVCSNPWTSMFVFWDGKVVRCADDVDASQAVGDLNHQSVYEVWTGDAFNAVRDQLRRNEPTGPCVNCQEWAMCKPLTYGRSLAIEFVPERLWLALKNRQRKDASGVVE
jgi:radical SAM protein with 4Fe4S-binding SPASM domain